MQMKDVDQTNPTTNEAFGQSFHGPWPVADGGRKRSEQTMEDVEQEPPTEGAVRTFQGGHSVRDQ